MQFPTVFFLGATCFMVVALVSGNRIWLPSTEQSCSLICAVRGNIDADGRYQFVEQTPKILYCNDGDKWKTISAEKSDISDAKSKFSCGVSPESFLEVQSQWENIILDGNCSLKHQENLTHYFDLLILTLNHSSMLFLKSAAETFVYDVRCQARLAAQWFRGEVSLSPFYCGSADQRLSHLVSWKIEGDLGTQANPARSCQQIYEWKNSTGREATNGVYTLHLNDGQKGFRVYCDMLTSGGAWTAFQRRKDGSVDFFRDWKEYRSGFGNLEGEFWLGLDKIHRLAATQSNILRIDMADFEGNQKFAQYGAFSVGDEAAAYQLFVNHYSGDAGDSLAYQNGGKFSTKDRDNDELIANCAVIYTGAWWYTTCHRSNLNGRYDIGPSPYGEGINWFHFRGYHYSLKFTEMKLREAY